MQLKETSKAGGYVASRLLVQGIAAAGKLSTHCET